MGKKILVLGAGLVSKPLVQYLLEKTEHEVVCASRTVSKAADLVRGHQRGSAVALNVSDTAALEELVKSCDLAVSLLPYTHHVTVAEFCLKHRRHLVTTSYVSPAMRALDAKAKEAGVCLLNEIGLDPGIDHMSAMRVINEVAKKGGKVVSFRSYCGGLPAPEANDNPLGYKFSWSPRGVLMAGRNAAKYLDDGTLLEIPGPELFKHYWYINVPGCGPFEAYPNRDSMPFMETYGLQSARTMFRGTLRNPGWCQFLYKMAGLGWLNEEPRTDLAGKTWANVLRGMVPGSGDLIADLCTHWGVPIDADPIKKIKWLGLTSDDPVPDGPNNLLDLLCAHLMKKLELRPGERDMIILYHEFEAEYADGKRQQITSTLVDFGVPHADSAMSRTVSLPAAIAVRHILAGSITLTGVHTPVLEPLYSPVLTELESLGITCKEVWHPV